jgi:hypothetical protein
VIGLKLHPLAGYALFGHIEHRPFDPHLGSLFDLDELHVLKDPGHAAILLPDGKLDVRQTVQIGKSGNDRQRVRSVDIGEAAEREKLIPVLISKHPRTGVVAVQKAAVQRLPEDGNHVECVGVVGHEASHR